MSKPTTCLWLYFYVTSSKGVTVHLNSLVGSILDFLFPAIFCSKLQVLQFARLALFELMETSSKKCQSQRSWKKLEVASIPPFLCPIENGHFNLLKAKRM